MRRRLRLYGARTARRARLYGRRRPAVRLLCANLAADAVIYIFGVAYYYLIAAVYMGGEVTAYTLFVSCFALFIPGDVAQCLLSALVARRAIPLLGERN